MTFLLHSMSQVHALQQQKPLAADPSSSSSPSSSRRSRAVACAECRRLKLKCDREFPCMNCRRREVASLCPHGSLVTRSRVSNVAVDGAGRRHDVKWMLERIRQLEDALALLQSKVSDEPHPLLLPPPSSSARTDIDGNGVQQQQQSHYSETAVPPPLTHLKDLKPLCRARPPHGDDDVSGSVSTSDADDKPRSRNRHSPDP